jgi:hypothetical protein
MGCLGGGATRAARLAFAVVVARGVRSPLAEIIPIEPDQDNTCEGMLFAFSWRMDGWAGGRCGRVAGVTGADLRSAAMLEKLTGLFAEPGRVWCTLVDGIAGM